MPRKILVLLVIMPVFAAASTAPAALCPECSKRMLIDSPGKCESCGAATASGALRLCPKCSDKLHRCELCGTSLDGWRSSGSTPASPESPPAGKPPADRPPADRPAGDGASRPAPSAKSPDAKPAPLPTPPTSPPPIDLRRPGTYASGKWQYRLDLASPGTRGEGQWGWLWYGGQKLPRGEVNDYYRTPWGPIYWVDVPQTNSGMHGWMPVPSGQSPRQGRPLALPAALAAAPPGMPQPPTAPGAAAPSSRQSLEVTKADNGKRARVYVGNVIVVRLPGNPTTGYQWQAVPMPSPVLRLAAQPQYVASPAGVAGGGGTFVFVFQPLQPGAGAIRLVYARPLERDRPAADAFNLSVEVLPSVVSPSTPRTGQPGPNPMGAAAR